MKIDIAKIIEIVRNTDSIIFNPEYLNQITVKGPADYVTVVDKLVQEYLYNSFQALYPDFDFMGEEKDNSDLDFTKNTWIIDPIDGTTNLIHDCRFSAVSVGLWNGEKQKMELGIIYQPYSKELFYGADGQGAFLCDGTIEDIQEALSKSKPIHVSNRDQFKDSVISAGTTPYHKEYAWEIMKISHEMLVRCSDIRRVGSAALDIAYVASGRIEGYFEKILSPWDYAAGNVILKEAGGCLTDYDGKELAGTKVSAVCCSNGLVQQEMLEIIQNCMKEA